MRGLRAMAAALLLTAACAPVAPSLPPSPVPAGPGIVIVARPVALDPADPSRAAVGRFTYAGGVVLTSLQTSRLHGLSDLKVWPDGRVLAVGDQGDLLEARLALGADGRLTGLADARLRSLIGEDGGPLSGRGGGEADAEGIAELPGGERLVSFEQHDRVLAYAVAGAAPRRAPSPAVAYVHNKGLEALAAYPAAGADAYLAGVEATGETYVCRLSGTCVKDRTVALSDGFELTAVTLLPAGGRAYLLRAFDPLRGARAILRIVDAAGVVVDELRLGAPLTVDNFEGLAVAVGPDGAQRFYLLSDDNFSAAQRTLLLAFDRR